MEEQAKHNSKDIKSNLRYWDKLHKPPEWALKKITGGRLSGKTDINPQWRYHALTELFGPCGMGWKYTIDELWSVEANEGQMFAFARISLYVKNGEWSEPIPGIGGSMLIEKEKGGLHANDEGYKMAITDALSTAFKMLGVAADVYMGLFDGKYADKPGDKSPQPSSKPKSTTPEILSDPQRKRLFAVLKGKKLETEEIRDFTDWLVMQEDVDSMEIEGGKHRLTKRGVSFLFDSSDKVLLEKLDVFSKQFLKGPPDDNDIPF